MFNDPFVFLDSPSQTESIYASNILNEIDGIQMNWGQNERLMQPSFPGKKGKSD